MKDALSRIGFLTPHGAMAYARDADIAILPDSVSAGRDFAHPGALGPHARGFRLVFSDPIPRVGR